MLGRSIKSSEASFDGLRNCAVQVQKFNDKEFRNVLLIVTIPYFFFSFIRIKT